MVLNEIIEDTRKSKDRRLIFKIDFEKAYDSIKWDYLLKMLSIMKFTSKWIKWIKECVSSA